MAGSLVAGSLAAGLFALAQDTTEVTVEIPESESLSGTLSDDEEVNVLSCGRPIICVGDDEYVADAELRGFFSFDLSGLPPELTSEEIESATLEFYVQGITDTLFEDLGVCDAAGCTTLLVEQVDYGDGLEISDFDAPVLEVVRTYGGSDQPGLRSNTIDVLDSLRRAWDERAALGHRVQYRLRFARATDGDGEADALVISRLLPDMTYRPGDNTPKLNIVYSAP